MNKSKKIIKEQGLQTPDKKEVKEKAKSRKNLILILIGIIVILGGIFVVLFTQLRPREVLSVEGPAEGGTNSTDTVYYTDTVYDIYKMESMYNAYGMDWDQDSGASTLSDSVKDQIMDSLKQREVLVMQAAKDNTVLDENELKEVDTSVEEAMKGIEEAGASSVKGLSEKCVRESIEKEKLADKEKQKIIDGFDIDDEAIKAEVNKNDFRQYTLQYYTISKKQEGTDGSEKKDKDSATISKDKQEMEALQKKAQTADDFSKLITDSDSDSKDDKNGITFGEEDLVETDESFADEAARTLIKKMANNQISNVIETDDAFYVVKMINNNDPEAYDNEVKSKIQSEENTQFNDYYDKTLKKLYTFHVSKYWKDMVQVGYITATTKAE